MEGRRVPHRAEIARTDSLNVPGSLIEGNPTKPQKRRYPPSTVAKGCGHEILSSFHFRLHPHNVNHGVTTPPVEEVLAGVMLVEGTAGG